jgi:hypothetical protein
MITGWAQTEGAALGPFAAAQTHQIASPGRHLVGRPPGEREEQDPIWCDPSIEEAGHARSQGPALARARPSHQRGLTMGRDRQLGFVESLVPGQLRYEHMFGY